MKSAVSAYENLKADFAWFPEAVLSLAQLAPVIAVVWGVIVYFRTRIQDREDELRRERLEIYRKYLVASQTEPSVKALTLLSEGLEKIDAIRPFAQEIELIAPDEVAQASIVYMNTLVGNNVSENGNLLPKMSASFSSSKDIERIMAATNPMREARQKLVFEMRKDLISGTKISPKLTTVEELTEAGRIPQ